MIALLGRADQPTDAVRDYCARLAQALAARGVALELSEVRWADQGWPKALRSLWKTSRAWRGRWVLFQHTGLMWSRRGFPVGALVVLRLLKWRGARLGVVFHDISAKPETHWLQRLRLAHQYWVMRTASRWAECALLTVPPDQVPWLPRNATNAVFVPVGSNFSPPPAAPDIIPRQRGGPAIAAFCITGGARAFSEAADIAYAAKRVAGQMGLARLVVLGRGSREAEAALRQRLDGAPVEVSVLGLLSPQEVAEALAGVDVLLFVRGHISSRRSSAIAGIACGLPVVGYRGAETASPITEAGVQLVAEGNRAALAEALCRVLTEEPLRQELRRRSLRAYGQHFSWEVIAAQFLAALGARNDEIPCGPQSNA